MRPWLLLLLLLSGLAGCAALQPVPEDQLAARSAFLERAAALDAVSHWRFAGRLTLELPAESWSGQLNWRTEGLRQVIDLSGPMGRGGGRLMLGGDQAVLITREGDRYEAADADELMALVTGRAIPVGGLDYWVRGMPRPGVGFDLRADADGLPRRLIQDGWEIVYGAFEEAAPVGMPMSVELHREDTRLRLIIQRWQLTQVDTP
nr:lipoprotein insertase outer membrane protein LolB [Thioalkalivibrio sp.]